MDPGYGDQRILDVLFQIRRHALAKDGNLVLHDLLRNPLHPSPDVHLRLQQERPANVWECHSVVLDLEQVGCLSYRNILWPRLVGSLTPMSFVFWPDISYDIGLPF